MTRVVAITGAPASGKTTVAQLLGRSYSCPAAVIDNDWLANVWPWHEDQDLYDLIADNLTSVLGRLRSYGAEIVVVCGVLLPNRVLASMDALLNDPALEWVFYGLRATPETLAARVRAFSEVQDPDLRSSMAKLDLEVSQVPGIRELHTDNMTIHEVLQLVLAQEETDGQPVRRAESAGPAGASAERATMKALELPADRAKSLVSNGLTGRGVDPSTAGAVATELVAAHGAGIQSHGLIRAVEYLSALDTGQLHADAHPDVSVSGRITRITGAGVLGERIRSVVLTGLLRALPDDIAFVRVSAGGHIGRLGSLVRPAAESGLIVLGFANYSGTGQKVALTGGVGGRIGTNPIVFACPVPNGPPMVVDLSTSAWSEGKLRVAAAERLSVPDGVLLDRSGGTVNDPGLLYPLAGQIATAALAPLGAGPAGTGHKGSALALIAEVLGGAVGGEKVCAETAFEGTAGNSAFFIAFHPLAVDLSADRFADLVADLEHHVSSTTPIDPERPVRLPGRGPASVPDTLTVDSALLETLRRLERPL
jgi:LDH2 family malate/lactate/ureidoglycolate dehydrogenase